MEFLLKNNRNNAIADLFGTLWNLLINAVNTVESLQDLPRGLITVFADPLPRLCFCNRYLRLRCFDFRRNLIRIGGEDMPKNFPSFKPSFVMFRNVDLIRDIERINAAIGAMLAA